MSKVSLIERLEIVEKGLHDVLVEVVVREEVLHRHENWVATFSREEPTDRRLLLRVVLFCRLKYANPFEILLLLELQEGPVEDRLATIRSQENLHA